MRKLLCVLVICTTILTLSLPAYAEYIDWDSYQSFNCGYLHGDINGDGFVTLSDLEYLTMIMYGLVDDYDSERVFYSGDINYDARVGAIDINFIEKSLTIDEFILHWSSDVWENLTAAFIDDYTIIGGSGDMPVPDAGKKPRFSNSSMKKVYIRDKVTSIVDGGFANCQSMISARIGESVRTIGSEGAVAK